MTLIIPVCFAYNGGYNLKKKKTQVYRPCYDIQK